MRTGVAVKKRESGQLEYCHKGGIIMLFSKCRYVELNAREASIYEMPLIIELGFMQEIVMFTGAGTDVDGELFNS
jgi:hypothetical protein